MFDYKKLTKEELLEAIGLMDKNTRIGFDGILIDTLRNRTKQCLDKEEALFKEYNDVLMAGNLKRAAAIDEQIKAVVKEYDRLNSVYV